MLIVGGGPVGLATSIALSHCGVRSLLVERHRHTSQHPKARGVSTRTMEIFGQWGIATDVAAAALQSDHLRYSYHGQTLVDETATRTDHEWDSDAPASPARACLCPQDVLEPILVRHARNAGPGEMCFGTELLSVSAGAGGATATIVDRDSGRPENVETAYVVAADGASSVVRRQLRVAWEGDPAISHHLNVLFRADLSPWLRERPASIYLVSGTGIDGLFAAVDGVDRWLFMTAANAVGDAALVDLIRRAIGAVELEVEILSELPWSLGAAVAQRYRVGSVFLAGDAAHVIPPSGGLGMNTGIADAHNLAWKLAGVLEGWAAPSLLDSYDAERKAAARRAINLAIGVARERAAVMARTRLLETVPREPGVAPNVVAIGERAPHVRLASGSRSLSTLDLFGSGFVALGAPVVLERARRKLPCQIEPRPPVELYSIGDGGDLTDVDGSFARSFGIDSDEAVLIRPDGHLGWRGEATRPDDIADALQLLVGG